MIWCAELGSCHGGSKSLCFELIRKAVWAGSNLIKVQLGWSREAQDKYCDSYDERRFIDDWVPDIDKWCKDFGVEWFASIWSLEGLEVARSVGMKRYKIAHQIQDEALVKAIKSDGREVFRSSLEIPQTREAGCHKILTSTQYPTYPPIYIPDFPMGGYGYSSHMHGIADALIAVARGAEYIEKHLTLYKHAGFPKDASFALVPEEFKQMTEIGAEIARLR